MASCKLVLDILAGLTALLGYLSLYSNLALLPKLAVPVALCLLIVGHLVRITLSALPATILSCGLFVYCLLQLSRSNVVTPTISLLVLLLAVRLVAERGARHYLQIFALSLFLLAASTVYEISVTFSAYLLTMLFVITAALVLLTFYFHKPDLLLSYAEVRKVAASALLMELAALPLMAIIFLILPRTQYPLWRIMPASTTATAGFSESVNPGAAGSMSSTRTPVLRAEMQPVPKENLYWRGIVLNTVRQGGWERNPAIKPEGVIAPRGYSVRQVIQMEPGVARYLCTLDIPVEVKGTRALFSTDRVLVLSSVPVRSQFYEVVSVLADSFAASWIDMDFYLRLPVNVSPGIRELARRVSSGTEDVAVKIDRVEREFRSMNLVYSTRGLPTGSDPLDEFLFAGRQGNCEFFASALVTILRASGVPARLVGGYYGGEYNEVAGYYLVTQDMAHVWVEAYQEGTGWRRIDPSAWSRGFLEQQRQRKANWQSMAKMYIDAVSYFWDRNIVPYDLEWQIRIVSSTGNLLRGITFDRKSFLVVLVSGAIISVTVLLVRYRRDLLRSPEERLLRSFERVITRRKMFPGKMSSSGLYSVVSEYADPLVTEFVAVYCGAVYRDRKLSIKEITRLRMILKLLRNN